MLSRRVNTTVPMVDGHGILAIVWVCFCVATIFLLLRFAIRLHLNRGLAITDYWLCLAWLALITMNALLMVQMPSLSYLMGEDDKTDPDWMQKRRDQEAEWDYWLLPINWMFWTTIWAVKMSFLAIYYPLLKPKPLHLRLWYLTTGLTALSYIFAWVVSIIKRVKGDTTSNDPTSLTASTTSVVYSTTVDVVTDLLIMALPMLVIPKLQLDIKKKIGLVLVFSLAVFVIIAAIVRLTMVVMQVSVQPPIVETVDENGRTILVPYADLGLPPIKVVYVNPTGLVIWSAVECATAIIVASLLPLKGFFARRLKQYHGIGSTKNQVQSIENPQFFDESLGKNTAHTSTTPKMLPSELKPLEKRAYLSGIYVQRTVETKIETSV